jgi:hypothetical protein
MGKAVCSMVDLPCVTMYKMARRFYLSSSNARVVQCPPQKAS